MIGNLLLKVVSSFYKFRTKCHNAWYTNITKFVKMTTNSKQRTGNKDR